MKAEVNKTVEVVLRLSEAEARGLRTLVECVVVDKDGLVNLTSQPQKGVIPPSLDGAIWNTLDEVIP